MTDLAQRAARILELQAALENQGNFRNEWLTASHEAADLIRELLAENERLAQAANLANDGWHAANGVADLAMKHRDMAEKQLAAIMGKFTDWRAELEWGSPLRVRDEMIALVNDVSTDEFAAVDAGPTPLRGRVTRRDE